MKNSNDFSELDSDVSNIRELGNYIDNFTHEIYAASNAIHSIIAEKESILEITNLGIKNGGQNEFEFLNQSSKYASNVEATTQTDVSLLYTLTNPTCVTNPTDRKVKPRTLCRLCAALVHRDSAVEIYKGFGKLNQLDVIMNKVIPNKVKQMDGLPQLVCMSCVEKLNICSIIHESFVEADKKLRAMLHDQLALMNQSSSHPICVVSGTQGKATRHWRNANRRPRTSQSHKVTRKTLKTHHESDLMNLPISATKIKANKIEQEKTEPAPEPAPAPEPVPEQNNVVDEQSSIPDLSVLDPEHDSGLEVEWCLDDEVLHTAVTQKYSCTRTHIRHLPDGSSTAQSVDVNLSLKPVALNSSSHQKLQDNGDIRHKCDDCSLTFKSIRGLISHKAQVHNSTQHSLKFTSNPPSLDSNHDTTMINKALSIKLDIPDLADDSSRSSLRCFSCSLTFPSKRDAFIHKLSKHSKDIPGKYIKSKSDSGSSSEISVFSSNNSQPDSSIKQCSVLEAANEFGKLQEHKCVICDATFKNEYRLFIHKNLVHEKLTHSDTLTNSEKKGSQKRSFSSSQRPCLENVPMNKKPTDTASVQCPFCVLVFTSQDQLDEHCQIHLKLMCMKCGAVFTCKEELTEHMHIHKPVTSKSKSVSTSNKPETLERKQKLKESLNSEESTNLDLFLCKICGKMFSQAISLLNHERLHSKSEKLLCSTCGETFQDKALLTVHLQTHIKKDAGSIFECNICKKKFFNQCTLHSHKQKCTSDASHNIIRTEKWYICNICSKGFLRESNLRQHRAIHTDNVPFRCRQCLKAFNNRTSLITHKGMHKAYATRSIEAVQFHNAIGNELRTRRARNTDKLGIPCNLCVRVLANMQCLKTHMARHSAKDLYGSSRVTSLAHKMRPGGAWHNNTTDRSDNKKVTSEDLQQKTSMKGHDNKMGSSTLTKVLSQKDVFGGHQRKGAVSRRAGEMSNSLYIVQHSMKNIFSDVDHNSDESISGNRMTNSIQMMVHSPKDMLESLQSKNSKTGNDVKIVSLAPMVEHSSQGLVEDTTTKANENKAFLKQLHPKSFMGGLENKNPTRENEDKTGTSTRVVWRGVPQDRSKDDIAGDLLQNNSTTKVGSLHNVKDLFGNIENNSTANTSEDSMVSKVHTATDLFSDLVDKSATMGGEEKMTL